MMAISVPAMAKPNITRRIVGVAIAFTTGDAGSSSSAPKAQAENMNRPSPAASIRYSGQCARSAAVDPVRAEPLRALFAEGEEDAPGTTALVGGAPRRFSVRLTAGAGSMTASSLFVRVCMPDAIRYPANSFRRDSLFFWPDRNIWRPAESQSVEYGCLHHKSGGTRDWTNGTEGEAADCRYRDDHI